VSNELHSPYRLGSRFSVRKAVGYSHDKMHKALLLFVGQEMDYWQCPCSCGYQLSSNIIIPQKYFVEELTRENVGHLPKSITNEYSVKER